MQLHAAGTDRIVAIREARRLHCKQAAWKIYMRRGA